MTVDEFVSLKDQIEEAATYATMTTLGSGWAIVEDTSNDPIQYMEDGDLVLTIRIEGIENE